MATTAKQLEDYCSKLKIKLNGIYYKDSLPDEVKEGSYIINLDNHTGPGTHWTALYVDNKHNVLYFDSFGLWPPDNIEQWLKKNNIKGYQMSTKQIQDIRSGHCGEYCILFLYYMTHLDFIKFSNLFGN